MFKKLRIKFIAITMVMVAIVMALAFSVVCVVEYQRSYSVVQTALSDAAEQAASDELRVGEVQGRFGDGGQLPAPPALEGESVTEVTSESPLPPFIGKRDGQPRGSSSLIPVAVYAIGIDGQTHPVPQVTTASISDDVLSDAMGLVEQVDVGFGTLDGLDLHYYKVTKESGTFFVFADTSYTDSWKTLATMLAAVGLVTLCVFFVITLFYSRWALRPVREAWDSQRQFVADASHDLKTPLTVVLANAAILLKHPERTIASESQWIESTQKEAENMQGLVNEMLELAQVEAGEKVEVEKERFDLSDLVDGETLQFDSVALERGCSFECEVEGDVAVFGNGKQIEKMVSTLVENAFKYVDDGGRVDVTLRRSGKKAVLSIANTGATISDEDLPHIFDRFYRTDKARTSGEGGFGLGLAIAREVARQHSGDIACASGDGRTVFTVTLPVA